MLLGPLSVEGRVHSRARQALLFTWSQTVGLGFAAGTILATLGFVVFTDLAFGWSTTLDVEAAPVHRVVAAFAKPWAAIWPAAAPTLDLVETSRYFRVSPDVPHVHFIDPVAYGAWWPRLYYCSTAGASNCLGRNRSATSTCFGSHKTANPRTLSCATRQRERFALSGMPPARGMLS